MEAIVSLSVLSASAGHPLCYAVTVDTSADQSITLATFVLGSG
jgi:hypothetical protein